MDSINDFLAMKTVLDDDDHRHYCDDCYCHRRNGLGDTALAYINKKIDELVEIYNPIEFEKIKLHILHELDKIEKE